MSSADFIADFTYRKGTPFDGIRRTSAGDCDDFAWSLLCELEGGVLGALLALATGNAQLHRVRSPVNRTFARHVALRYRTSSAWTFQWIDSTNREWRDTPEPHETVRRMRLVTVLPLLIWGTTPGKIAILGAVALPWLVALGVI
jgi:hypothetical protein